MFYNLFLELLIFCILILLSGTFCSAKDTTDIDDNSFTKLAANFFSNKNQVENSPNIDLYWGISFLSLPDEKVKTGFSPAYIGELKYGFTRINYKLPVKNRLYYAADNVIVGNLSSHFKPKSWHTMGVTSDNWHFGFSYGNGYGYLSTNGSPIILYHAGSISWSRIDFENPPPADEGGDLMNVYDSKFKIGSAFEGGLKINIYKFVYLNTSYEHLIIYRDFWFPKWIGVSLIELVPQRLLDIYSESLLKIFPDGYPIYNFVVKNAISALFYELRRKHDYFPFKSEIPVNYDIFRIGISGVF